MVSMFKRNAKLAPAFEAIAVDHAFNKKCNISKKRANAAEVAEAEAAAAAAGEAEAEAEAEAAGSDGDESGMESGSESEVEEPTPAARKQADYLEVKRLMKDEEFVENTKAAIDFLRPIMQVLRVADRKTSQHPILWERMASLDEHYSGLVDNYDGPIPPEQVGQTHQYVVDRWAYLHDSTHSVAYALSPHFHAIDIGSEESVTEDLETVFAQFYDDEDDQVKVFLEFQAYKARSHPNWKKPLVWAQIPHLNPWQFSNSHGGCSPLLRKVVMVILRLNHAAGSCERNWSTYDFLYGKRRASTSVETLASEIYYYTNQRMQDGGHARTLKKPKRQRKFYEDEANEIQFPLWKDKEANSGSESD